MILSSPERISPVRLTELLRAKGWVKQAKVVGFSHEAIGVGLFGDTVRFTLVYDREEPGAPASIAGKFPTVNEQVRANGASLNMYSIEIGFYQQIAGQVGIRRPDCVYAEIDDSGAEFGLLFEDMGPARAADQMAGCSRDDAERALTQAAALHAPRFGDAGLHDIAWLNYRYQTYPKVCADLPNYVRIFRERYEAMLEPEHLALAERFAEVAVPLSTVCGPRPAIIHGDFRLDNMLFDAKGGAVPLVVLDWQSVGCGNPCLDVTYFLGTSYPLDQRSRDEKELLRFYHEAMKAQGVRDYAWDDLWHDYRRGAWMALLTAIFASAVSKQTERGDRMFMRMYKGAAAQMLEHDTLALA